MGHHLLFLVVAVAIPNEKHFVFPGLDFRVQLGTLGEHTYIYIYFDIDIQLYLCTNTYIGLCRVLGLYRV